MDQKICDVKYRIFHILTNADLHNASVLLCNNTMHGKRQCHPLVFLYTTIIMGIQISQIRILVQRILLDIQSRRIDMCTENAHTSGKLFRSYMKQSNDLLHPYRINLVTGLDLLAFFKLRLKRFISGSLCFLHDFCNTFPFRFSFIQKFSVSLRKLLHFCLFCFLIRKPRISSFHLHVPPFFITSDRYRFSSYYLQSVYYYRSNIYEFPPQFPFFTKSL